MTFKDIFKSNFLENIASDPFNMLWLHENEKVTLRCRYKF